MLAAIPTMLSSVSTLAGGLGGGGGAPMPPDYQQTQATGTAGAGTFSVVGGSAVPLIVLGVVALILWRR